MFSFSAAFIDRVTGFRHHVSLKTFNSAYTNLLHSLFMKKSSANAVIEYWSEIGK